MKTTIQHDGKSVTIELTDGVLHRSGDFAGNIDLVLTAHPPLVENAVAAALQLTVPKAGGRLKVVGTASSGNRVEVTFYAKELESWTGPGPSAVPAYWVTDGREVSLGQIDCR